MDSRARFFAALAAFLWTSAAFAQAHPNQTLPIEKIDAVFSKFDRDRDGTLDREEAKAFGLTSDSFKVGDQNGDGKLDRQEFAAAISYQFAAFNPDRNSTLDWKGAQRAGITNRKIFDGADADHDGTLDVTEYLAALLAHSQQARAQTGKR